ncbi:MAG: dihydrolipoamide acetyltransferase family protein [Pelolinea sp.]|nr:dihydrolipoamide acetyltransferase family protein [Pelolinea sp.]
MAKEIIMPKFGFTQEESEIMEWLHSEGDSVEKGDPIAVVSTDKISMEVEAPETGTLSGIRYQIGEIVPVTEIIAYILQPGERLPEIKGIEKLSKIESPKVKKDQILITPIAKKLADENSLDIDAIKGTGPQGKITKTDVENSLALQRNFEPGKERATPAARKIGREKQIDLSKVSGSGPKGRIQAEDMKQQRSKRIDEKSVGKTIKTSIPMIGMRRTIAQNMKHSWNDAPHMTLQINIPMDELEILREELNSAKQSTAEKISLTALITKAVAVVIRRSPIINSQYTEKEIKILDQINIGIATALEDGLIVPVVHHADKKDIKQISDEIKDLSLRSKEGKLEPIDLTNATFTISNLGMYGIDSFMAIINPPQSAILAVGKMTKFFVPAENNLPMIQKIISFTLSADHRVMDGAQAAKFLSDLKEIILDPKGLID